MKTEPLVIRQSLLGDVDTCLRRAQYKIELPPPMISTAWSALGTAYHKALEIFYKTGEAKAYQAAVDVYWDEIEITSKEVRYKADLPNDDKTLDTLWAMLNSYFDGGRYWPVDRYKVLGVEESFTVEQGDGSKFHGTIDLVLEDQDSGWTILVDHKTAGRKWKSDKSNPRRNNQSPFYSFWWQELHPETPGVVFFFDVMTYKGEFSRLPSISDERHQAAVMKKATDFQLLYELVRGAGVDLPVNPSSTLCSPLYCDFWDVCPSGEALDV